MSAPELEELARLISQQDAGRYFWQDYVERLTQRLDGLPAPGGGESFLGQCLAAGVGAIPVARRNTLWEARAPDLSEGPDRGVYELQIRLGLFYAASLRYLVHGLCRLRVESADTPWHIWLDELTAGEISWRPLMGGGVSFRDYLAACKVPPEIAWEKKEPNTAQAGFVAGQFFTPQEMIFVTMELAVEVMACVLPGRPRGLFGRMLVADGQIEIAEEAVDVAGVFMEALVEAVSQKVLRVNTRADGHVFVTPEFWLLTTPIGLDCVKDLLRTRREGRKYNFARREIFAALSEGGHLFGVEASERKNAARVYEVDLEGWAEPLELHGLAIAVDSLHAQPDPAGPFEGTVTFKREISSGSDNG